jgi:[NiFe] hydrogenase diaphorase moiety small subunit
MSETVVNFMIDGVEVTGRKGQTIMQAADEAGIYIPRLCWVKKLKPSASCRLCTVLVNNRPVAACTQPVVEGMDVLNEVGQIVRYRKNLVAMLFVEGNHFCASCEKSGNCELQAMAYRFGMTEFKFPNLFPKWDMDASHPYIYLDRNRCIFCGRCIRASRDLDGKGVFEFIGRGHQKKIGVNARARLADTNIDVSDEVANICPVGAILKKRVGFAVPIGKRLYDHLPIGSDIEAKARRSTRGK